MAQLRVKCQCHGRAKRKDKVHGTVRIDCCDSVLQNCVVDKSDTGGAAFAKSNRMKTCRVCSLKKGREAFSKNQWTKAGRRRCKACVGIGNREKAPRLEGTSEADHSTASKTAINDATNNSGEITTQSDRNGAAHPSTTCETVTDDTAVRAETVTTGNDRTGSAPAMSLGNAPLPPSTPTPFVAAPEPATVQDNPATAAVTAAKRVHSIFSGQENGTTKLCGECSSEKGREAFSKSQWTKRRSRRCKECIDGSMKRTSAAKNTTVEPIAQLLLTEFFNAIRSNNLGRLRSILGPNQQENGDQMQKLVNDGLLLAIHEGQLQSVKLMLQYGGNESTLAGGKGECPLFVAVSALQCCPPNSVPTRMDIIKSLLDAGIKTEAGDNPRTNPLIFAFTEAVPDKLEVIRLLLKYGADPGPAQRSANGTVFSPLTCVCSDIKPFLACEEERVAVAQALLKGGADPGVLIESECTVKNLLHMIPTMFALPSLLELILASEDNSGIVHNKVQYIRGRAFIDNGFTPLHSLVYYAKKNLRHAAIRKCAVVLLKAGADPFATDGKGVTVMGHLQGQKTKSSQELQYLVMKAWKKGPSFWESDEVNEFIADGKRVRRCACCAVPSYFLRRFGLPNPTSLKTCSKCTVTYYCSRNCQRVHWKRHEKVCKSKEHE